MIPPMDRLRKKIIIVDDNIINLTLGKSILLTQPYDVFTVPSGEKLFKLLEKIIPDLILLDIEMPVMDGYEVIKQLKSKEKFVNIPVIFLTIRNDASSEIEGLNLGAIDYISKPFSPPLLLKRIELHLLIEDQKSELTKYNSDLQKTIERKTKTILDMQSFMLKAVVDLVEFRDVSSSGHLEQTYQYLKILLDTMVRQELYQDKIAEWDMDFVLQSSMLHDVGKIAIRDSILLKPGKLSNEEFEEMKKHTIYGVKIIEKLEQDTPENEFLQHAKIFAGTHHERWDGAGYPYGLKGEDIPLEGRLLALADVYDALISERPYRTSQIHKEGIQSIKDGRGTQFDPFLTDIFVSVADQFEKVGK
jgi:putative two-component system response regulator